MLSMRFRQLTITCSLMLAATQANATLPPMLPRPERPPLSPERLGKARLLVRSLPLESGVMQRDLVFDAAQASLNWYKLQQDRDSDENVARFFGILVSQRAQMLLPQVWEEYRASIAVGYASTMDAAELDQAISYFATPSGQRFALMTWTIATSPKDNIARHLHEKLATEYRNLLTQARAKARDLQIINTRPQRKKAQ